MQERKAPVFVAATCNNVMALPPELIRKGRFDELFFVDLPNQSERKQIFALQLNRHKHDASSFDLDRIANAARGFSGAEIGAAVQSALFAAYNGKRELSPQILLDVLSQTVPLSITRAEEIEAQRAWAKTRAVPASSQSTMGESA
jgi:SpoVK/Ycf46/Vps4 family AAA+-type ATPase